MARSYSFRMTKVEWSTDPQKQLEIIETLTRRLEYTESLLAANAALTMALAEKAGIQIYEGLGHLDKFLKKGPQQMDNMTEANHRMHDMLKLD